MNGDPNGDACLTNADVAHYAQLVRSLKDETNTLRRHHLREVMALVQAAGGRIEFGDDLLLDMQDMELIRYALPGARQNYVYEVRKRARETQTATA